jgi:hypothetical protein
MRLKRTSTDTDKGVMPKPRWSELVAELGVDWPSDPSGPNSGARAPAPRSDQSSARQPPSTAVPFEPTGAVEDGSEAGNLARDLDDEEEVGDEDDIDDVVDVDIDDVAFDGALHEPGLGNELDAGSSSLDVVSEDRAGPPAVFDDLSVLDGAKGENRPTGVVGLDRFSDRPARSDRPDTSFSDDPTPAPVDRSWPGEEDRFEELGSNVAHAMRVAYGAVSEMKRLDQRLTALLAVQDALRETLLAASDELHRSLAALTSNDEWP